MGRIDCNYTIVNLIAANGSNTVKTLAMIEKEVPLTIIPELSGQDFPFLEMIVEILLSSHGSILEFFNFPWIKLIICADDISNRLGGIDTIS